jgi:hypothetical protein
MNVNTVTEVVCNNGAFGASPVFKVTFVSSVLVWAERVSPPTLPLAEELILSFFFFFVEQMIKND